MFSKKYLSIKFFCIGLFIFGTGVISTVIATTLVTTETRAQTIWETLERNVSQMNMADANNYYKLVKINIKSLIEVLNIVDEKINQKLAENPLPSDGDLIDDLTKTGNNTVTPKTPICGGIAPMGDGVIKSTSLAGMVGSDQWSFVANTRGTSTDLGMSCTWTCIPGYTKNGNGCIKTTINTPPVARECTGNPPTSSPGLVIIGFNTSGVVVGPSTIGTSWMYADSTQQSGCTWSCKDGYTRDGNTCKPMAPGSGLTINVFDEVTNVPLTGVKVSIIHSYCNATSEIGSYMTDSVGKTSEFYLPSNTLCGFIFKFEKAGYMIKSGTNCTSRITGGNNYCSYDSGNSVTVRLSNDTETSMSNPKTIYTDSSLSVVKNEYKLGDTLYGYVVGGDKNNTWGCMDIPGGNNCSQGIGWRQLTKPYDGQIDGWQNNTNHDNRIEFQGGLYISPEYPTGVYTGYTKNGENGTPIATSFTVSPMSQSNCKWNSPVVCGASEFQCNSEHNGQSTACHTCVCQ